MMCLQKTYCFCEWAAVHSCKFYIHGPFLSKSGRPAPTYSSRSAVMPYRDSRPNSASNARTAGRLAGWKSTHGTRSSRQAGSAPLTASSQRASSPSACSRRPGAIRERARSMCQWSGRGPACPAFHSPSPFRRRPLSGSYRGAPSWRNRDRPNILVLHLQVPQQFRALSHPEVGVIRWRLPD